MNMAYNTAYLDELVAEYLTYRGFFASLKVFKQDQRSDKSKGFNVDKIVDFLMTLVASSDLQLLRSTWSHLVGAVFSRLPDTLHIASAQRVEVALYKLYLVQAFQNGRKEKVAEFFQVMSSTLIGNADSAAWKDWLAFPYVTQPSSQAPFAVCFTRPWQDSVTISLTNLLMIAFNSLPKPRLVLLMEHIAKIESDLMRIREAAASGKDTKETLEMVDHATSAAESLPISNINVEQRPSRRLLSFFTLNKTPSPAPMPNASSDFRRTKSQSSFPRQQPQPLFGPGAFNRLSDIPMPENPGEFDYGNRLGIESETDDTVVISKKEANHVVSNSDSGAPDDAFAGHNDAGGDNESGNEDGEQQAEEADAMATISTTHAPLLHALSQSLPSSNFMEKVLDTLQPNKAIDDDSSNAKRNSNNVLHRKHVSTTKFTCLDTERTEVPGCHGSALVRYSPDGRFLGVLSQSAQAVFIFSAESVTSRGVISSALVSSPPSCFCIGSLSQRSSSNDDDLAKLAVVVGSSTTGRIYVFSHTDTAVRTSKMAMSSSQLLLVPLEPGTVTKQHSVLSIDVIPSQLDVAVTVVAITDNQTSKINPVASQIYVVSLTDLVVMRRVDPNFTSPLSCLCALPNDLTATLTPTENPSSSNKWLVACGDSSGSIYAAHFAPANQLTITWQSLKLLLFSKIINIQPLPDNQMLVCDSTGRFAICRVDVSSSDSSLSITPVSECDAFCSTEVTTWPSASPDGQFAAVLFDRGASLFLVNISSPDFGDIAAQLPGSSGKDAGDGNSEHRISMRDAVDFTSVAWTPSVLQTAFTYIAALTKAGDLLVFRLLT